MNKVRELHPGLPPRRDPARTPGSAGDTEPAPLSPAAPRRMGEWLAELRALRPEDLARIGSFQHDTGLRFGEAAVALGLASRGDVDVALSRQFRYPYLPASVHHLSPELPTLTDPFGAAAERFRSLRSQLAAPGPGALLAVTSLDRGDGRSWCAANLAISMAQRGGPVLLVDADLRSPRQHHIFGLRQPAGLSALLDGRADLGVIHAVPQVPGLYLLSAGAPPPNPLELLERPAFEHLLADLGQRFSQVVLDTPAAARCADAAVLAAHARQTLLVLRRHVSRQDGAQHFVQTLARRGATVAGVMLNEP